MNVSPPIVILTALELEYKAVRDRLSGIREPPPAAGTRFEVGAAGDGEVVVGVTGHGTHGTAALAERAVRVFDPAAVLFVGVARALRSSVRLGDIVVATHVYTYERAAVPADGPRVRTTDDDLVQTARRLARRDVADGSAPLVHFGPVASGQVRPDLPVAVPLRWLRPHYDDALAVELEPGGAARAGHLSTVPVGVIRGIGERADSAGGGTDGAGWPPRAARNAAAFAVALAGELLTDRAARAGELITEQGRRAEGESPAGEEAERRKPDIRNRAKGGTHGAVAGFVLHHNARPGRTTGPGREERGRR
ncbi:purine phosphorylase [Actinoplanes sp. NPDC049265]|uniref:5'-methylthioadenosine/S-adenosylhomocysteine nucleosidase family protein n=1 Tax=Actinoplanes sp. NPDC049265 TaxID=3363902 RepID=UPI00371CFBCE